MSFFAFLRTEKNRWAFSETGPEGFESSSKAPSQGAYWWVPDFFLTDKKPFLKAKNLSFLTTSQLRECLQSMVGSPFSSPFLFEQLNWHRASKNEYEQTFLNLKEQFLLGHLSKAVPVVIDEGELPENQNLKKALLKSLLHLFDQMAALPETLHPFFLAHDEWIFGATPETLLKKNGDYLKTHAVAGTTSDLQYSLLNDPKEMKEHRLVVEDIDKVLACYGPVKIGESFEKHLPTLKHLVTEMELDLLDAPHNSAIEIALKLHPTPALGGTPKYRAFDWLALHEGNQKRRRYGAPFGFVSEESECHLVVAIRALQVVKNKLLSIAGAGVIEESLLEKEWEEIELKKRSVFKIFEG